jgi:hypothetical protein
MQNDKRMHFWIRLTRVTDKAPGHKFFACTGTDAETTGRFCESLVRVGFATVYDGQKQQQVFDLYKDAVVNEANEQGFSNVLVTQIGKREYDAFFKSELRDVEAFDDALAAPAYRGERMIRK